MMIQIVLDSEGENRRGILRSRYSPFVRWCIIALSAMLVILANLSIFSLDGDFQDKFTRGAVASVLIPFVTWFFWSYKYTSQLGAFTDTLHVLSGEKKEFTYTVSQEGVIEVSEQGQKIYPYSEYVKSVARLSESWLVFKKGLIYLPGHAVLKGSESDFIDSVEKACSK